jgi:hypothetical protein
LGAQKFLADNNYGPAGDGFYEFQKEHQTVQELKKQVTELTMDLQKVQRWSRILVCLGFAWTIKGHDEAQRGVR